MTLIQSIKIMLALIDEFAPNNTFFTDDEDIRVKTKLLYSPAYQELSDIKMLSKSKELNFEYTGEDAYQEIKLPNAKKIQQIMCLDEKNRPTSSNFYYLNDKTIMANQSENVKYICEFIPNVTLITDETPDDFTLELTDDMNKYLAYKVAGDLLKTDPSVDYRAFEQRVREMFGYLDTTTREISVTIGEGEF